MAMSLKVLLAAAEKTVVTDEKRQKLKERLAAAEKRFAKKDGERKNFPPGFLDREFTL